MFFFCGSDIGKDFPVAALENVKSVSTERRFPCLAGRPRRPVCAGARLYMTKRNGKIRYFIPIPDRYAKHDTHKAVSIQIVGTVVCGMVKQF